MMRNDFAIFILSHGRADNIKTIKALQQSNYSGKYYIVCDDEDVQLQKYKENYGEDKVLVFSKSSVNFDIMDNFAGKNVIVFARNVIFDFAKQLGLTYFWELQKQKSIARVTALLLGFLINALILLSRIKEITSDFVTIDVSCLDTLSPATQDAK